MTRRLFLLIQASTSAAQKEERVPTDPLEINAFVDALNAYTQELRQGIVDVKAWGRVVAAWRRMTA